MNTGDYCPRGRELYAEYMVLLNAETRKEWFEAWFTVNRLKGNAYRKFSQHVEKCTECKHEEDE